MPEFVSCQRDVPAAGAVHGNPRAVPTPVRRPHCGSAVSRLPARVVTVLALLLAPPCACCTPAHSMMLSRHIARRPPASSSSPPLRHALLEVAVMVGGLHHCHGSSGRNDWP
eukprot:354535-Chlamydomonas_euryale.AAC.2